MSKELDFIADLLGRFLAGEDPETVARILSRLDTTLTAVLRRLPEDLQGEVVYHLFQLRAGEWGLMAWTVRDLGGVKRVAKILNRSSRETEKKVLELVDKHDPELAEELRNQMFVFDDIVHLTDHAIQQILREVDTKDLAVALKGASENLKDRIFSNVSERVGTIIKKKMESLGPVRMADVEDVQLRIVCTVRQLDQAGAITTEQAPYIL